MRDHLVEPHIITEVRITIQLDVAAIRGTLALAVTSKDVNDSVLNLLSDVGEIHVIAATSWAFNLHFVSVILVEPLKTLDEDEVDSEP